MRNVLLLVGLLAVGGASAQVHRCIDAAGKAAYSDTPCATSAKRAEQVLGREATESRFDPYAGQRNLQSIERARAIQQGTVDRSIEQAQGPAAATMLGAPNRAAAAPVRSAEVEGCETRTGRGDCIGGERRQNPNWSPRRGYFGGGGPADQRYEADRARRAAASEQAESDRPATLTNCNAGGCWDDSGNRYNRTGDGSRLVGPTGQVCREKAGGHVSCN